MRCIVLERPGKFRLADAPEPGHPPPGHARVRVRGVGICGTDMHAFRGRQPFFTYPRILGHELGVEVVEAGENDRGIREGDRCAVEPYLECGHCIACRRGRTNCCAELRVLGVHTDGGMQESIILPVEKLHRSNDLALEQLALVETLGIGAHAVDRGRVESGENVLVLGAGPIGLAVIQFATLAGARVTVAEAREDRLAFCRDHFPIRRGIQSVESAERLDELLGGELPTAVFDATGHRDSMLAAFRYLAQGGRLIFVGLFQGEVTFDDPEFHRRELTLLSSRNSRAADFRRVIRRIEEGQVDTRPWITHRAFPDGFIAQFERWLEPGAGVVKALLEF